MSGLPNRKSSDLVCEAFVIVTNQFAMRFVNENDNQVEIFYILKHFPELKTLFTDLFNDGERRDCQGFIMFSDAKGNSICIQEHLYMMCLALFQK